MSQQITLDLPEAIVEQAQILAKREGRSLSALLVELIEHSVPGESVYPTETPYGNEEAAKIMQDMIRSSALPLRWSF